MMGSPHHGNQAMSHSNNLGKCLNPHDDLGADFDECPLFENMGKFFGACGCHMRLHEKLNLGSRYVLETLLVTDLEPGVAKRKMGLESMMKQGIVLEKLEVATICVELRAFQCSVSLDSPRQACREVDTSVGLDPKHKIFLSYSGNQKNFVEQLCVDLERFDRYAFFDKDHHSLPIGENFPRLIFEAIHQCHVGVVILSEEFFTSKWPMMELVAMVDEAGKRGDSFKIIPVFLHSALDDIGNASSKIIEWRLLWDKWALKNPDRINSSIWEAAVKYLRPINGLKGIDYDKLGEVEFRKAITEAICRAVPSEVKFEVSHIQGGSRLCEVIKKKILNLQQKDSRVCVVGVYGVGGIGKTSICKVLCNEFSGDFKGRVCHAELERMSEKELLQDVLERLTDTNPKICHGLKVSELEDLLKRGIGKQAVFLALDNVSDASVIEAERYLSQSLMPGSIVIVTARSLDTLLYMRRYLEKSSCMEMPELEVEEAKSLFMKSSEFEARNEIEEQVIMRCIERCRFQKGSGNYGYHYHPLALDVLGRQLRGLDAEECEVLLGQIHEDIFNQSRTKKHPIFSILRTSFESLCEEDQLLFMDIALYLPGEFYMDKYYYDEEIDVLEWLGMVHGIGSGADVKRRLEILKRRSLLESLDDGVNIRIGMHDLWREFSVAETEYGEIGCRRWLYQRSKRNELFESSAFGGWQNVKRIAILDYITVLGSLERVNFSHFPNVKVLGITGVESEQLVLNLSGMVHLKSLEVRGNRLRRLILRGLPRDLQYLSSVTLGCYILDAGCYVPGRGESMHDFDASGHINLRTLHLRHSEIESELGLNIFSIKATLALEMFPTLSHLRLVHAGGLAALSTTIPLKFLSQLYVSYCKSLRALPDLGMFPALSSLVLAECGELRPLSCSAPLTSLSKLVASSCRSLKELPDLGMFPALSSFKFEGCGELRPLSCSAPLTSLSKLDASSCKSLRALPDLGMFPALSSLELQGCGKLPALSCSAPLTSLSKLDASWCRRLKELPDLGMFPALSSLDLRECGKLRALSCSAPLTSLSKLDARFCLKLKELPDLGMFPALSILDLCRCDELRALSCSAPLTSLSKLDASSCWSLKKLPDLGMFPALSILDLCRCGELRALSCCAPLTSLSKLDARFCWSLKELPDLGMFPALSILDLCRCDELRALSCSAPLTSLSKLDARFCWSLKELPDLGMFPALSILDLCRCDELRALSWSAPLTSLSKLDASCCRSLKELPDLGMFPALSSLDLWECGELRALSCSAPLTSLSKLDASCCWSLKELPDLGMFPALSIFDLCRCGELRALSCSSPLTSLSKLDARFCWSLKELPDLGMFPELSILDLCRCDELRAFSCSAPLTSLSKLDASCCRSLKELPDLGTFPALSSLDLRECGELRVLSCSAPLTSLSNLDASSCWSLKELPDLGMFPALSSLDFRGCGLTALSCSVSLTSLSKLDASCCRSLKELPDLGMFPALSILDLCRCGELRALSCSAPLTSLSKLDASCCRSLKELPDLGMFPALSSLDLWECGELRALSCSAPLTCLSLMLDLEAGCEPLQELENTARFGDVSSTL